MKSPCDVNDSSVGEAAVTRIPARRIWYCGYNIQIHTDYRNPMEKEGRCSHSLKRRAPQPLPWQAFIVFLGPLHQRWSSFTMQRFVLSGYLLQTTKERMSLNTSKKDICNVKGEMVKNRLCSIPGRSSSDFRKIKILSKHLLASGWGSFSKSKSHSSQGTMQAWFPTGELIHGHGSCPPTSLPTGFSKWGLSHISHEWNSSPHSRV